MNKKIDQQFITNKLIKIQMKIKNKSNFILWLAQSREPIASWKRSRTDSGHLSAGALAKEEARKEKSNFSSLPAGRQVSSFLVLNSSFN